MSHEEDQMSQKLGDELVKLERQYWQAIKDHDLERALALTADPCVVAGASGVSAIDRASFKQMMDSAQFELRSFEIRDVEAQPLGQDAAVLAYTVTERLVVEGKPLTLEAADTSVWTRRNGGWKCAMHTESLLGDAFGRDRKRETSRRQS
jgi:hypothetical protein